MRQMHLALFVATLFLASLLAGCVTAPTSSEASAADYGTPLSQPTAEQKAEAYLSARLKDPASATYQWQPLEKGWREGSKISRSGIVYGYLLTGKVNAKNSFGGYTGAQTYSLLFRDGQLVAVYAEKFMNGQSYMEQIL